MNYVEYHELWSFNASELQTIKISYSAKLDKIFCTALITYPRKPQFRTDGFSITTFQIGKYIKDLKEIISGKFDKKIEEFDIMTNKEIFSKIIPEYRTLPYEKTYKKSIEYLEIIIFHSTEIVTPLVSYMCSPNPYFQDIKFNEDVIRSKFSNDEKYLKEKQERLDQMRNSQKFYFNAKKSFGEGKTWRTKGFSLYRYQIPTFIAALENIESGELKSELLSFKKSKSLEIKNKYPELRDEIVSKDTSIKINSDFYKKKKTKTPVVEIKKEEKMTDDEIRIRQKHDLSGEELQKYMDEIKKHSKKMQK